MRHPAGAAVLPVPDQKMQCKHTTTVVLTEGTQLSAFVVKRKECLNPSGSAVGGKLPDTVFACMQSRIPPPHCAAFHFDCSGSVRQLCEALPPSMAVSPLPHNVPPALGFCKRFSLNTACINWEPIKEDQCPQTHNLT